MLDPGPYKVPEPLCITVQVPIPLRKKVAVPMVPAPVLQHCSKQRNGWWECVCQWFPVYNNLHKPTTLEMETEDLLVFLFD